MIITIGSVVKDDKNNEYKLVDIIGQGGFGIVYKAVRVIDSKEFAVKTLSHSFTNEDDFKVFKNEIMSAQMVSGENIIKYEYVHNGEIFNELPPYIIMEYANGGTLLSDMVQRRKNNIPYTKEELYKIFIELINGMKIINDKLVHRDIKPDNILISNGILKISDFGLAKIANESTRTKTLKGYGTLKYIAPEAWDFNKNTIQMDIYSMGIIFYELATLEYPYDIKNNDIEEFKKAHLYSSIKNSKLLKERTTLEIYSMIMGMLEKATQKRFKTWDDILQHVKKFFVQSASQLDAVVNKAVQEKTERDIKIQQEIELKKKREEYIANFCSLVKSQFENDILAILNNFVESYNNRLSSIDKSRLLDEHSYNQQFLVYKLIIPSITTIDIKCSIVLEKSIQREYFDWTGEVKTMWTTPVLKGRNVMCIISIENNNNYGFNLVLLASDGLYGDWFIVNNRNNLISRNDSEYRREPFAFNTNELDEIIISNEAMHIYSSKLLPFSEECFLKALSELLE